VLTCCDSSLASSDHKRVYLFNYHDLTLFKLYGLSKNR
jgi:hypothetical protein